MTEKSERVSSNEMFLWKYFAMVKFPQLFSLVVNVD